MTYYEDVYKKRLNRYGLDYQSRVQGQREREFDDYLNKSVYRVNFHYNGEYQPGVLEPHKQSNSTLVSYLLTRRELMFHPGEQLVIPDANDELVVWTIWWMEEYQSKGYNRYVVFRADDEIFYTIDGARVYSHALFEGSGTQKIRDVVKSGKREGLYAENESLMLITAPYNDYFRHGAQVSLHRNDKDYTFTIVGLDTVTTEGVAYLTVTAMPTITPAAPGDEGFWIKGGDSNGT